MPETEKQPDVQENYEVPSEEQSFVQEDYEVPSEELPQCEDEAGEEEITEEQLKWKLIQLGKNGPAEIKRTCVCSGITIFYFCLELEYYVSQGEYCCSKVVDIVLPPQVTPVKLTMQLITWVLSNAIKDCKKLP